MASTTPSITKAVTTMTTMPTTGSSSCCCCAVCGGKRPDLKRCSRCKLVWYCDQSCQTKVILNESLMCVSMFSFKLVQSRRLFFKSFLLKSSYQPNGFFYSSKHFPSHRTACAFKSSFLDSKYYRQRRRCSSVENTPQVESICD